MRARFSRIELVAALVVAAAACGDGGAGGPAAVDATTGGDAAAPPDGADPRDGPVDGPPAPPLPGFGAITGMCGVIGAAELDGSTPLWFQGELDFGTDRYDDPAERDRLTPGGREILIDGNAGGSSVYSELFAFEWLARCEQAELIKTENEIVYDVDGKKADLLVAIAGRKVGVSVTRAMTFPFGNPYTPAAATSLFERKLDDIQLATAQVSAGDRWSKQMLAVLAFDAQHAEVAMAAWNGLDAETRDDTLLVVAVTSGDDLFIYTDE